METAKQSGDYMEHEKIALFDMDGTLTDYIGQMQHDLLSLAMPSDPVCEDFHNTPKCIENRMDLIKRQQGWWLRLPRLELGFKIYDICVKTGFTTHVLTKGPRNTPSAWGEKLEWCKENGLMNRSGITVTLDKGLIYGRVLVDDYPDYMLRWLKWRPRGLGIMPAHSYNKNFDHPNVIRCDGNNMDEIAKRLQLAYDR